MHALRAYARNDPSQLIYEDHAPLPMLTPGDVLLRVQACGVTPSELAWPTTWLKLDDTPRTPPIIPGHEVAGVVEALGPTTEGIAVGDEVYGLIAFRRDGADAEYAAVSASDLAPKPKTLAHEQAAAVPLSALTAWQALFDYGNLQPGQRVLIHGGAGGVGSFAIQFARWRGAHVTTTASMRDTDLVQGLGADEVIDYRSQRFEDAVENLALVLDTVGGETSERSWHVLGPHGKLVSIAVPRPPERESVDGKCAIWFVVEPNRSQLIDISGLIDGGHVRPIISAVLPLAQGREAYGAGPNLRGAGKVVLRVATS